jgi:hypothetical protein
MTSSTTSIFISYRRDDSAGFAGRLADALEAALGPGSVFRDVDDIAPGEDFVTAIEQALARSAALLVVIGRHWLQAADAAGRRRLDQPQDFVRLEIRLALERGIRVIPLLVDRAAMPTEGELPPDIAPLARRQAVELDDSRWTADIERLVRGLGPAATRQALVVEGIWSADDDLRWIFTPTDAGYRVETFRTDGGGIWARGTAHRVPGGVEARLDLVYSDAHRYFVQLQPNEDGTVLSGTSTELVTGTVTPIGLRRQTQSE